MRAIHTIISLDPDSPEWGGAVTASTELIKSLAKKGVKISIFTTSGKKNPNFNFMGNNIEVHLFNKSIISKKVWKGHAWGLFEYLINAISDFDIFHIHELWHYPQFATFKAAKKANKPYIITVHGELEPWCLNYKRFKKRVFSVLIQRKILREAAAIHALTQSEAEQVKAFGINNRIVMIPNGIDIGQYQSLPSRKEFEEQYLEVKGKKMILFLSRIHPKKGLDILVKSFSNIARSREDYILVIAGPDDEGYKKTIEQIIKSEGISKKVIFTGMLTGKAKLAALSRADIFVLPSYSEGFSMAILEAMACGLPVVITNQCHFPEVEQYKAGLVIEPNVEELSKALETLLSNSELRRQMGNNGKKLVKERYTWDRIADQMIEVYKDIIEKNI